MERKTFELTISELTLASIIRILADYLEPKDEKSHSWEMARDDMVMNEPIECIRTILATLDYVNPPLYGMILGAVTGFGEDEEEEGDEHDLDA